MKEAESDEPPPSGFAEFMLREEDGFWGAGVGAPDDANGFKGLKPWDNGLLQFDVDCGKFEEDFPPPFGVLFDLI